LQKILTPATQQQVLTIPANKDIIAAIPDKQVFAPAACQGVIPPKACQQVVVAIAFKVVVARTACPDVRGAITIIRHGRRIIIPATKNAKQRQGHKGQQQKETHDLTRTKHNPT
jgi:hypothetical protein